VAPLSSEAPRVTVAVPVKDRRERMLRCLDALLVQDYPDYEVLVLDNGSSDGTPEACAERAQGSAGAVRVEVVEGRVGRVRNVGARMARGEIVAYTDSDCIPSPGWLSAAVRGFDDPAVGVVTGVTLPEHPPPYEPWHATMEVTGQTWHFESCNALFRREPLLHAGGFDEDLGHFAEDTMAGWAMLRAGWDARFEPEALVYHDVTYPGRSWHLRRVGKYGKIAAVLSRFPESRERLMWHRYFMRPRNAAFAAALVGVALAPLHRGALLLSVPYLRERGPRRPHPGELRDTADRIAIDASVFAGAVRGSLRWRTLVL
jgi:glycosyltransferase involved in cell wall biosynthesis